MSTGVVASWPGMLKSLRRLLAFAVDERAEWRPVRVELVPHDER